MTPHKLALAAVTLLAIAATAAPAQDSGTMDHSSMGMHAVGNVYSEAMETMMTEMEGIEPTGDPDVDFLLMMIPHHQSAVDMARALLEQSDDAEVSALAQAIIEAQEEEIAAMTVMLERLGHPVSQ